MKKLFLLVMIGLMLTGCGVNKKVDAEVTTDKEVIVNEVKKEEEDKLQGMFNYSKEYLEEKFYNGSNAWETVSHREWETLKKEYGERGAMYILMVQYGDIEN